MPPSPTPWLTFEQVVSLTVGVSPDSMFPVSGRLAEGFDNHEEARMALVRQALESRIVRLDEAILDSGEGVLVAWDYAMEKGLPRDVLDRAASLDPSLGPTDRHGRPPFAQVLSRLAKQPGASAPRRALDWMAASTAQALGWGPGGHAAGGGGLLAWLADPGMERLAERFSPADWDELVGIAKAKGLDWFRPRELMERLPSGLLEALVGGGLDLEAPLGDRPLWQRLLGASRPDLTGLVKAASAAPDALEAADQADYLAGFWPLSKPLPGPRAYVPRGPGSESVSSANRRTAILNHLVSRPNWDRIVDGMGRSALFHAVLADPGVLRNILALHAQGSPAERARWARALSHRDREGRNVWFYLLARPDDVTLTARFANQLGQVVGSGLDSQGRGWVFQLLADPAAALEALRLPGNPRLHYRSPAPPESIEGEWFGAGWEGLPDADRTRVLKSAVGFSSLAWDALKRIESFPDVAAVQLWLRVCEHPGCCDAARFGEHVKAANYLALVESAGSGLVFPVAPGEIQAKFEEIRKSPEVASSQSRAFLDRVRAALMAASMDNALPAPDARPRSQPRM